MLPIEKARVEDLSDIIALQRLAFMREVERTGDWQMPAQTQTVEQLAAEHPSLTLLVARDGGQIVGTGRARADAEGVHLGRLAVHPRWQGRGIGTSLVAALEAAYPDATRFEIFTSDGSADNIRLYGKLGYREYARRKASDFVTLVYMQKLRAKPSAG